MAAESRNSRLGFWAVCERADTGNRGRKSHKVVSLRYLSEVNVRSAVILPVPRDEHKRAEGPKQKERTEGNRQLRVARFNQRIESKLYTY